MPGPFKAIMNIRRSELPLALLMFFYFFSVITTFWILKPLKSAIFIQYYDETGFEFLSFHLSSAQAELLAKILNLVVALIAVWVFSRLSRNLRREQLTYVFGAFFMVAFAGCSFLINSPGSTTVWMFYLLGDLFTTLMVTTFFAFLNDSVTPDGAKRLYGLIVLGGALGGALGPSFLRVWIDDLSRAQWLWICFAVMGMILVLGNRAGRRVRLNPPPEPARAPKPVANKVNPAFEGAQLVFRSRYLLAIVAIVALYEVASQVLDFQFKATVAYYLSGDDIGRQITLAYAIANWVSVCVQLFLTSLIMTRLGLTVAILVLPTSIALGSGAFLLMPVLWAGSLLPTADSGFAYGLNQSAKEALYVPLTRDEKYKAKAFIDMFVQRFGKVLAIGVSLAITIAAGEFSATRWLSIFTLAVVAVWYFAARYAGHRFDTMTRPESREEPEGGSSP